MPSLNWKAIRAAAQIPSSDRSEADIDLILDAVRDVELISKLRELQQRALCRILTAEDFESHSPIFHAGEVGDKYYIIIMGSVRVMKPVPGEPEFGHENDIPSCPGQRFEQLSTLGKGMGFGDLALQSDEPRSATVVTAEPTVFLIVKRHFYQELAGIHKRFIEERVNFLLTFPKIACALETELVDMKDLSAMANLLHERHLHGNEVLVQEGEPVDNLIFVRSGQLSLVRAVNLDSAAESLKAVTAKSPDSEDRSPEREQSSAELARNLARSVMMMRRKERRSQLADIEAFQASNKSLLGSSTRPPSVVRSEAIDQETEGQKMQEASGESDEHMSKWPKLQTAFGTAKILRNVAFTLDKREEKRGEENSSADTKNLDDLMDGFKARERVMKFDYQRIVDKRKAERAELQKRTQGVKISSRRHRLFVVGHLEPFMYFGDEQICNSGIYPFTVVGDPVADVYLMSKTDIVRRLPRKLYTLLFSFQKEHVMGDAQLLQMLRQNDRWVNFRKATQESLSTVRPRGRHEMSPMPLRDQAWKSSTSTRVDPQANLAFLGSGAPKPPRVLPARGRSQLTAKDEVMFSDSPAAFVRSLEFNKRDKALDKECQRLGMRNWQTSGKSRSKYETSCDPSTYVFERLWARCGNFPELDLGDDRLEETPRHSSKDMAATARRQPDSKDAPATARRSSSKDPRRMVGASDPSLQSRPPPGTPANHAPPAMPASARRASSKCGTARLMPSPGSPNGGDSRPSSRASPTKLVRESPLSMAGTADLRDSRPSSRVSPSKLMYESPLGSAGGQAFQR